MLRLLSLVFFCIAYKNHVVAPLKLRQGRINKAEDDFDPQAQGHFEENWTQENHWRTVPTKTCPSDEYSATMSRFLNSSSNRYFSDPRIYLAEDFIENELKSAGLQTFRQEFDLRGTKCYNVIGILPGSVNESRFVLIGAHHDTLPEVGLSQGVDDNGAGTVSLLEIARIMKNTADADRKFMIVFASFSTEEENLAGSNYFVGSDWFQKRKADLKGAFIMDQVGANLNHAGIILETSKGNLSKPTANKVERLMSALSSTLPPAQRYIDYHGWGSDHMSFLNNDLPAVLVISLANRESARLFGHSTRDDISHLNVTFASHVCSLVATATSLIASDVQPIEEVQQDTLTKVMHLGAMSV